MCLKHWERVSPESKERIHRMYMAVHRCWRAESSERTRAAIDRHDEAIQAAVMEAGKLVLDDR
jgi:hypothetical protein